MVTYADSPSGTLVLFDNEDDTASEVETGEFNFAEAMRTIARDTSSSVTMGKSKRETYEDELTQRVLEETVRFNTLVSEKYKGVDVSTYYFGWL